MATSTVLTNKPINPRGDDNRPVDSYNRASLYSGKALDFDGVNDYVDCGTLDITAYTAISVAMYLKADSVTSTDIPFSLRHTGGDDIRFVTESNGLTYGIDDGTLYQIQTPINVSEWYYAVLTFDGSTLTAYLNGQAVESMAASFDFSTADGTLRIGKRVNDTLYFDGSLANTKVFDIALTAAQVADLYNNPEKIVPTGVSDTALKLWLPMMEGAGTTCYDGSGNGNHGTISGATWTHGIGSPVAQTAVIDWNKPYYFDGVDDSFTTGTYQALGDRTITLSFYSSDFSLTTSFGNTLFAFNTSTGGNTDIVRITNTGYVAVYDGGVLLGTPTIQANENELTHVAIVTDAGTDTKVYVNGELSYSYNAWSPSVGATDIFNIGQETDGTSISDVWRGFIFNVGVFDTILTQSEIQAIQGKRYADLTSAQKTNLVSFYSLQNDLNDLQGSKNLTSTGSPNATLIPQGLTAGRDLLGNLFENVRKQGALNLDGNSWAEVHDNASVDVSEFTLEAWVHVKDVSVENLILSKWSTDTSDRTFHLRINTDDISLFINDGTNTQVINYTNQVSADNWYHIIGTYDESNLKLYLNGSLVNTYAATITLNNSSVPIQIGRYIGHNYGALNPIAQPRIYNRALTASEVLNNYNATKDLYI